MSGKKRILVVDDEEDILGTVKMRLSVNNYEVLTARDGQEALEKAHKENPDLVILDLMLPKIDGYKVCRVLKSDDKYKNIPVVILTARAQESDIKYSKEVGADAYVTKPFEAPILLAKIKELLSKI